MDDFLDVSVWVALSAAGHPHHLRARQFIDSESSTRLCFCRASAMGLMRVISQRHTSQGDPLSPQEAWAWYEKWRDRDDVNMLADPTNLDAILARWVASGIITAKHWTDAYFAAVAVGHSLRFVTFDKGFRRFPGLDVMVLE